MTIFGIGPLEFLVIVLIALVVVGPERLPEMLFQLGQGMAKMRRMVLDLRNQARTELGDDYETFENMGRQIRELDPRRQIQEFSRALLDDVNPSPASAPSIGNSSVPEGEPLMPESPMPLQAVPLPQPQARQFAQDLLTDELLDQPLSESLDSLENTAND